MADTADQFSAGAYAVEFDPRICDIGIILISRAFQSPPPWRIENFEFADNRPTTRTSSRFDDKGFVDGQCFGAANCVLPPTVPPDP